MPSKPTPPPGYGRNKRLPVALKLWIAVVVANVSGLLVSVFAAAALRAVPATDGAESALRALYYGTMCLVALVDALWLDEVLFKGSFRRTHLSFGKARQDDDTLIASVQRSDITFPFSAVVFGVVTYFFFNVANHDFDRYYDHVGKHVSALRGSDEARLPRRIAAIETLSIRRSREVLPVLFDALERDDEVASWAAWAIGRHTDIKRRRRMVEPLVAASRRGDRQLEREAIIALGRLQHRPTATRLVDALEHELEAGATVDVRLIWALGYVQQIASLPVLERALYHRDETVARVATWAIAQHRDQREGRQGVRMLEQRLPAAPFAVKCAIVHSLGILSDEASNAALVHGYQSLSAQDRRTLCPIESLYVDPDGERDRQDLLMPRETYAMKTLQSMGQMRATASEVRAVVEPWLVGVAADQEASLATREAADSLLTGIRQVRDDSLPPAAR
ncbi:MAG: hypothetical protein B7733_08290 [Myxococcales bacterium FL481]|nr:MAG: hypothetical protein B7733_08290 [Myxococcales bacterium FL481]